MTDTPASRRRTKDVLSDLEFVRREIVDPVLARVFEEGELERVKLSRTRYGWVRVWIVARGESCNVTISDDDHTDTVGDARAYFMSDVQDFVAESDFGWGQLRGPLYPQASDFE